MQWTVRNCYTSVIKQCFKNSETELPALSEYYGVKWEKHMVYTKSLNVWGNTLFNCYYYKDHSKSIHPDSFPFISK